MFRVLLACVFALSLVSCKTPVPQSICTVGSSSAAIGIAAALKCKDANAINTDILAYLQGKNVCQANVVAGTTGDLLCPLIATYITSFANGKLPAAWQCDLGSSIIPIEKTMESICKQAVTI